MNWINILLLLTPIMNKVLAAVQHYQEGVSTPHSPLDIADQLHSVADTIKVGVINPSLPLGPSEAEVSKEKSNE